MEHFEKTIARILPIPPDIISPKMTSEDVRVEAEVWCKPFACAVQGCSEPRVRTEAEKMKCLEAPRYYSMCVERIREHIQEIIAMKSTKK
jgi:hypothetical protein